MKLRMIGNTPSTALKLRWKTKREHIKAYESKFLKFLKKLRGLKETIKNFNQASMKREAMYGNTVAEARSWTETCPDSIREELSQLTLRFAELTTTQYTKIKEKVLDRISRWEADSASMFTAALKKVRGSWSIVEHYELKLENLKSQDLNPQSNAVDNSVGQRSAVSVQAKAQKRRIKIDQNEVKLAKSIEAFMECENELKAANQYVDNSWVTALGILHAFVSLDIENTMEKLKAEQALASYLGRDFSVEESGPKLLTMGPIGTFETRGNVEDFDSSFEPPTILRTLPKNDKSVPKTYSVTTDIKPQMRNMDFVNTKLPQEWQSRGMDNSIADRVLVDESVSTQAEQEDWRKGLEVGHDGAQTGSSVISVEKEIEKQKHEEAGMGIVDSLHLETFDGSNRATDDTPVTDHQAHPRRLTDEATVKISNKHHPLNDDDVIVQETWCSNLRNETRHQAYGEIQDDYVENASVANDDLIMAPPNIVEIPLESAPLIRLISEVGLMSESNLQDKPDTKSNTSYDEGISLTLDHYDNTCSEELEITPNDGSFAKISVSLPSETTMASNIEQYQKETENDVCLTLEDSTGCSSKQPMVASHFDETLLEVSQNEQSSVVGHVSYARLSDGEESLVTGTLNKPKASERMLAKEKLQVVCDFPSATDTAVKDLDSIGNKPPMVNNEFVSFVQQPESKSFDDVDGEAPVDKSCSDKDHDTTGQETAEAYFVKQALSNIDDINPSDVDSLEVIKLLDKVDPDVDAPTERGIALEDAHDEETLDAFNEIQPVVVEQALVISDSLIDTPDKMECADAMEPFDKVDEDLATLPELSSKTHVAKKSLDDFENNKSSVGMAPEQLYKRSETPQIGAKNHNVLALETSEPLVFSSNEQNPKGSEIEKYVKQLDDACSDFSTKQSKQASFVTVMNATINEPYDSYHQAETQHKVLSEITEHIVEPLLVSSVDSVLPLDAMSRKLGESYYDEPDNKLNDPEESRQTPEVVESPVVPDVASETEEVQNAHALKELDSVETQHKESSESTEHIVEQHFVSSVVSVLPDGMSRKLAEPYNEPNSKFNDPVERPQTPKVVGSPEVLDVASETEEVHKAHTLKELASVETQDKESSEITEHMVEPHFVSSVVSVLPDGKPRELAEPYNEPNSKLNDPVERPQTPKAMESPEVTNGASKTEEVHIAHALKELDSVEMQYKESSESIEHIVEQHFVSSVVSVLPDGKSRESAEPYNEPNSKLNDPVERPQTPKVVESPEVLDVASETEEVHKAHTLKELASVATQDKESSEITEHMVEPHFVSSVVSVLPDGKPRELAEPYNEPNSKLNDPAERPQTPKAMESPEVTNGASKTEEVHIAHALKELDSVETQYKESREISEHLAEPHFVSSVVSVLPDGKSRELAEPYNEPNSKLNDPVESPQTPKVVERPEVLDVASETEEVHKAHTLKELASVETQDKESSEITEHMVEPHFVSSVVSVLPDDKSREWAQPYCAVPNSKLNYPVESPQTIKVVRSPEVLDVVSETEEVHQAHALKELDSVETQHQELREITEHIVEPHFVSSDVSVDKSLELAEPYCDEPNSKLNDPVESPQTPVKDTHVAVQSLEPIESVVKIPDLNRVENLGHETVVTQRQQAESSDVKEHLNIVSAPFVEHIDHGNNCSDEIQVEIERAFVDHADSIDVPARVETSEVAAPLESLLEIAAMETTENAFNSDVSPESVYEDNGTKRDQAQQIGSENDIVALEVSEPALNLRNEESRKELEIDHLVEEPNDGVVFVPVEEPKAVSGTVVETSYANKLCTAEVKAPPEESSVSNVVSLLSRTSNESIEMAEPIIESNKTDVPNAPERDIGNTIVSSLTANEPKAQGSEESLRARASTEVTAPIPNADGVLVPFVGDVEEETIVNERFGCPDEQDKSYNVDFNDVDLTLVPAVVEEPLTEVSDEVVQRHLTTISKDDLVTAGVESSKNASVSSYEHNENNCITKQKKLSSADVQFEIADSQPEPYSFPASIDDLDQPNNAVPTISDSISVNGFESLRLMI